MRYLCDQYSFEELTRSSKDPLKNDMHQSLMSKCGACFRCTIAQNRNKNVFYRGSLDALIMWVAEAAGPGENDFGAPLVAKTGTYLDMLVNEFGLGNISYFCNSTKCWTGVGNPDPKVDEKRNCRPFLVEQIDIVKPRLIVAVGRHALTSLVPDAKFAITKDYDKLFYYQHNDKIKVPVILIFHPSYVLRQKDNGEMDIESIYRDSIAKISELSKEFL